LSERVRLDALIVRRGLTESRERAKGAVLAGMVYVDGRVAEKPGALCPEDAEIELCGQPSRYVSRGGDKLEKALGYFALDVAGMTVLDAGASTGGFTDCLLRHGAARVFAVDAGWGQLHPSLISDARVVNMERVNIRVLTREMLGCAPDLGVADLSFISLRLVLPVLKSVLSEGARVVCLVKPQFEVGRGRVGKNGVVRDPDVHVSVLKTFAAQAIDVGYSVNGITFSPLRGGDGNIEFLCLLSGSGDGEVDYEAVVRAAHEALRV